MGKKILYITLFILVLFGFNLKAQTDTEFWFVVPEIDRQHNDRPIRFVFTTTNFPADITLEMPANVTFTPINISLPANTTADTAFTLAADLNRFENRTVIDELSTPADRDNISNKGIRITSTAPITAYYEVNTTNNSDIWSLKGSNGLGKDFFIPFQDIGQNRYYTDVNRGFSSIEIIGTGGTTIVEIHPSKPVYRNYANPSFSGVYTITLEAGEVYTLPPAWDATVRHGTAADLGWWGVFRDQHIGGTYIHVVSGDNVAVVVKDDSVTEDLTEHPTNPRVESMDSSWGGWDIIADQWVPLEILGKEYVAMRGTLASNEEYVFVVATENNTRIWWTSTSVDTSVTLPNTIVNKGVQVRIPFPNTQAYKYIKSNKKLSVLHVSGVGTEMGGAVLPPIDKCTGSTAVGFTRSKGDPARFHMNIMVRTTAKNGFLINGAAPAFFSGLSFTDITGTPWSVARIQNISNANVPPDVTTKITNTMDVFHLGIINETDGGAGCRFGYFSDFNEVEISALSLQGGEQPSSTPRACIGDSIQLFASGGTTYQWWPSDGLSSTTVEDPKTLVTGYKVYYVKVSGFCNQSDTASISISPLLQPEASFMLETPSGCAPLDIEVRNLSTNVSRMYWDFNSTSVAGFNDQDTVIFKKIDGNDSIVVALDSTINHSFINTSYEPTDSIQTYEVKLKVKTAKCYDSLSTYITVYPEVIADFTLSDLDDTLSCNPAVVDFQSSVLSVNEDYYKWSFGDGALSADPNPTHQYNNVQLNSDTVYNAELVVRSQWFCRDTARMDFTVHPYLEGGFTIDKDKGCSPLTVTFTNLSAGEDDIDLNYGDGTSHYTTLPFSTVNHTYRNTGTTVLKYPISLTTSNDEGCIEIWLDTVTVYPEVKADYTINGGSYTGCNTRNATFTRVTPLGADITNSVLWTFGDGETSTSTALSVPHTYTNTTTTDQIYPFNMRVQTQYGCWDDTTHNIRINRAYADFAVNNDDGCSPLPVTITNTSIGTGITSWLWSFGDGTANDPNSTPVPNPHIYNNATGSTQNRYLRLTVTGTSGCSTFKQDTIDVFSSVDVTFTPLTQTGCDSLIIPFNSTIAPNITGTTYAWDFGDGTSSNVADPTHIYRNLTSASNIVDTAQITVTTPNGCTDNASTTITVRPYVNALFTVDKIAGCTPLTVDTRAITYIGIPTSNYVWSYGDGYNPTGIINPSAHTYPANPAPGPNDTYPLRLTVSDPSGLCTDFMEKTITVYAAAKANFTQQEVYGCNPFTVDFANSSSSNSSTFLWDFGDGTTTIVSNPPAKEFSNTTDATLPYNIQLTATTADGCIHDTTANIYVYRYVNADFAVNITEGCSPVTVGITNNSSGGNYRWYWNSQTGVGDADKTSTNSTEAFTHTYTNNTGSDITYYLTVVAENADGCSELFTREILVHSSITAGFTFSQPDSCNASDVVFTNTSIGGGSYTMNWNFGDGTSVATTTNTVNKTFTNNTTSDIVYTVILSAMSENGCPDTHQENITVWSRVEANFNIPISQGCPDAATQLFPATIQNTSIGNAANTYQWFINGTLLPTAPTNKDNFVHDYFNDQPAPRTYNIRLVATNPHGCSTEKTGTITVFEYVDAVFSITNPAGCTPWDVELENQSTAPASNTNYLWEYGDNTSSGISDPVHTHLFYNESRENDRPYTITLKVTSQNYCYDAFTATPVTIYHQPLAKFYIDPKSSCPPLEANMNNLDSRGYNMFQWIYGDGDTTTINSTTAEINRLHSYPNTSIDFTQNYWLKLYVESNQGCWHMDSTMLNVFPDVIADFTYDMAGCSPFVASFTNGSTSPATQFYWDFKDGSNSNQEDVLHRFVNDTYIDKVFNVKLTATSDYNCWDTISKPVMVYAQPVAMFNPTPTVQTFPEARVQLNSVSNSQPWDYLWTFDDGQFSSSSTEIFHDYAHWGKRNIELRLQSTTSNCADTITRTIMIYPPAVNAAFTVDTDHGCEPLDVQFTAVASEYSEIYNYEWDFGDGSTGTGSTPYHKYDSAGTYYVKMTASGEGGEDYEYRTIRVYRNPKANFIHAPREATLNTDLQARVEFFNTSVCADTSGCTYLWRFGDGNTSTERQLVYNYTDTGHYDVTLIATTLSNGCTDSIVVIGAVTVEGEGKIKFPNAFVPNQEEEPKCTYELKSALDLEGYIFHPYYEGILEYELWIYNRWGELIFKSTDKNCGWNGYVDGKLAKQDVYVWKAQGKFTNGKAFELAGDVTLIR